MNKRNATFVAISLAVIIAGLSFAFFYFPSPDRLGEPKPVEAPSGWATYRNEKYGFEIKHPEDWTVAVTESAEPKINIYKGGEREYGSLIAKPPFIHHNNVTQVSIFPNGIGTEGVEGETATSTIRFAEPVSQAIDFLLVDGSRWATYATFRKPPTSWQPAGFAWASVKIDNPSSECVLGEKTLPMEQCDLGDRPAGARIVLKGSIDKADRLLEERILETLVFWKVAVRGEIVCLPHKGNGPETQECAIGFRGDDGRHYGLLGLDQQDIVSGKWTTGVRALISGSLTPVPDSKYDIAGSISIENISPDVAG